MKLVIVGGGGFRVPLIHRALLRAGADQPITQVELLDTDPARLHAMRRVLAQLGGPGSGPAPVVHAGTDAVTALAGADFVFCAIRVGGLAGRVADERVAIAHGVLGQETVGAGGIAFGLRTIPVAVSLAQAIRRVAPQAWVINFTNPAGMITEAMGPVLGERVIGICDSPLGLARRVARVLGTPLSGYAIDYAGLNHLGWLQGLRGSDGDVLPRFLADDAAVLATEEGQIFGVDWLRAQGVVPNEYLHYYVSHGHALAEQRAAGHQTRGEFLARQQGAFFDGVAQAPGSALSQWESVLAQRNATYLAAARGPGAERHTDDVDSGGYEGVALELMLALAGGEAEQLILNIPAGARLGLPPDAVVELPCRVRAGVIEPLPTRSLRPEHLSLVHQVKAVERLTIEAALTGSAAAAESAFALHPLIDSALTARALLRDYRAAIPQVDAVFTPTAR